MISGVLLAAGHSRRFGGEKLLAPVADDRPMIQVSLAALTAAVDVVVVVVRPRQRQLIALLREQVAVASNAVRVCPCPAAEEGMGYSIACGVAATPGAAAWIVALADMPHVRTGTIRMLSERLRLGATLVAPCHGGRRGNPVGFSADYRDQLLGLQGDRGARDILARDASLLRQVVCDDPGVLFDVDTRGDIPAKEIHRERRNN